MDDKLYQLTISIYAAKRCTLDGGYISDEIMKKIWSESLHEAEFILSLAFPN